jgi:hypothetical protein
MNKNLTLAPSTSKSWMTLLAWLFLIVFAGKFILHDALPYFGMNEEVFGRFWGMKWPLVGHISGGLIALTLGPLQFWRAFRDKYLQAHRWMGKLYLTAILIGTISSTSLAWTTALAIHWSWAFALQMLAFAWFCTAAMAFISIKRMRIQQHKEWMIRSYVVTFAFVIFRWLAAMPSIIELGTFVERGPTLGWASWVIPLFVTEIIIQWNKK